MTQTERLGEKIAEVIYQNDVPDEYKLADEDEELRQSYKEVAIEVLKACKEAGLKWPINTDAYHGYWKFEEIEI